jgi:hypothetical protein
MKNTQQNPPQYIIRGGEAAFNPPYNLENTQFYGFVLEGNSEALQSLCDRYLNIPGQDVFHYRPVSHYVLMVFDKIGKIYSTIPEGENKGFFPEHGEVMFWILTEAEPLQEGGDKHYAWFIPYIFVDSGPAMILGREVYGFPKELAQFELPEYPSNPEHFSLQTMVLKTFSADSSITLEEVVKVQSTTNNEENLTPGSNFEKETSVNFKAAIEEFDEVFEAFKIDKNCLRDLPSGIKLPVVFLKQFRSEQDGNAACYQAIVEAAFTFQRFRFDWPDVIPFKLYKREFQVDITDYVSCPIAGDLGLQATQTAKFAFWVHFDFSCGEGKEVWSVTA